MTWGRLGTVSNRTIEPGPFAVAAPPFEPGPTGTRLAAQSRMDERERPDRLPLPSEDSGDLAWEPARGDTDDPLVAKEEGLPYVAPSERVLSEARTAQGGPDVAGTAPDDEEELRRQSPSEDNEQDLAARATEALRRSELPAGDQIQVGAIGSTIILRGEVESIEVADEMAALLGDLPGVKDVIDETRVAGDSGDR